MKSNRDLYWILAILSIAGYAWIGFHFFSSDNGAASLTVCLFKNFTGIPCPSCGVTRSLLLLMNGKVYNAVMANPLGLLAALTLLSLPFWMITDVLTGKNTLARSFLWTEKIIKSKKLVYMPLVALVLLNWGWNILKEL